MASTPQITSQYSSTFGHASVRIAQDRSHAQALGNSPRHLGHPRGSAYEDRLTRGLDPPDSSGGQEAVGYLYSLVEQVRGGLLELLPSNRHRGMVPVTA